MRNEHGFTYVGTLILVALSALALAATGQVWRTANQREKEKELLFIGGQFRQAISLYLQNSPGAQQYPRRLEDLLKDPRHPNVRRYLRRIYLDPMTGRAEWGLLRDAAGGIRGIHSLSDAKPLKTGNFAPADSALEGKTRYSAWQFTLGEGGGSTASAAPVVIVLTPGAPVPEAPPPAAGGAPPGVASPSTPRADRLRTCVATRAADTRACNQLRAQAGEAAASRCFISSGERYAECLRGGGDIPSLATGG